MFYKMRYEKPQRHHTIWVSIWWPDIPENSFSVSSKIHNRIHELIPITSQQIRDFRLAQNNPINLIPGYSFLDYKEFLWKVSFSKIELLEESVMLQILKSLEAVKNVERKLLGLEPIKIENYKNRPYPLIASSYCHDIIECQKLRISKTLYPRQEILQTKNSGGL